MLDVSFMNHFSWLQQPKEVEVHPNSFLSPQILVFHLEQYIFPSHRVLWQLPDCLCWCKVFPQHIELGFLPQFSKKRVSGTSRSAFIEHFYWIEIKGTPVKMSEPGLAHWLLCMRPTLTSPPFTLCSRWHCWGSTSAARLWTAWGRGLKETWAQVRRPSRLNSVFTLGSCSSQF